MAKKKKKGAWEIRLLSASYRREPDGAVIELYGITRDGEHVTALYRGFRPYFFLCEPESGVVEDLRSDENVLGVEREDLWFEGEVRETYRVTIKRPWEVPRYRNRYRSRCRAVLASDIPFAQRFIYDFDLDSCVRVRGSAVGGDEAEMYTTDVVVDADGFENIDSFKPPLSILSFDLENDIHTGEIYTICYVFEDGRSDRRVEKCIGGEGYAEKDVVAEFFRDVKDLDPDIITGYNIDNYDLPLLMKKAEDFKIDPGIGRDGSKPSRVGDQFWRIHGRIVADAWWNAKIVLRPKKETLNHLAKLLLGEEKLDVNRRRMREEWEKDPKRVMEYCLKDADLALRILKKIEVLDRHMDLATVSRLPVEDVANGRTSVLIDSLLIRAADREKIGVPQNKRGGGGKKIEGGYVHTIEPGVYDWVCVLDFKSMYPSIIISNNICFTTISEDGEIVSPVGVRFLSPEKKRGLVPRILEQLMKDREEAKRKAAEAKTDEERWYYDGLQNAIKVLMNSFYGVFASNFYRFTDRRIGESITAFARDNVKRIIRTLESEGIKVIYGDTDSIFFQSPEPGLENAVKFGREIAERFSKEGLVLEFEKALDPMFSHGKKKRYVGKVVWPEEDVIIRGYETRRTDSFDFQSEALMMVFERVLDRDIDGAISLAKKLVEQTRKGEVPVEKLVISRTCRAFNEYKDPDSQATVQAAKKMMQMGYVFTPGMKVSWVVVDSRRQPQVVEPWIDGEEFSHRPDYNYYAERVASTLARVTEVFGVDERELLLGDRQKSILGDFASGAPKSTSTSGPRKGRGGKKAGEKSGKKGGGRLTTLEDWF